jgi:hypothetical protein
MPWKHISNQIIDHRPLRVRLESGVTVTGEEITDQLLAQTGWEYIEQYPEFVDIFNDPNNQANVNNIDAP